MADITKKGIKFEGLNATFAGDVSLGATDKGSNTTLSLYTNDTYKTTLKYQETSGYYGFSTEYDGNGNTFTIKRHSNSQAGVAVMTMNRDNANTTFAGNIDAGSNSITAGSFVGNLSGNVNGNVTGNLTNGTLSNISSLAVDNITADGDKVQIGAISSGTLNENTGVKLAIIGDGGDNNDGLIITRDNGNQNQLDQFINIYNDGTSTFVASGGTSTHGAFDFKSTNDKGDTSVSRLAISAAGDATFKGDMSIVKDVPSFDFVDSNSDSDFRLRNNNGVFEIYDTTNSAARLSIASDGGITGDFSSVTAEWDGTHTGTAVITGDLKVTGSSEDLLAIASQSAGSGTIIMSMNAAENAYEPLRFDVETFKVTASGGTSPCIISTSGLNTTFGGTITAAHTLDLTSDGTSGWTNSRVILNATQADSRGAGIFMHNTAADKEFYAGVPYDSSFDKWMVGYASTASHGDNTAAPGNSLFEINSSGDATITGNLTLIEASDHALIINRAANSNAAGILIHNDNNMYCGAVEFKTEYSGTDTNLARVMAGTDGSNGHLYLQVADSSDSFTYDSVLVLSYDNSAAFKGHVSLPATKKLFLDGGNDTYLHEISADRVGIYVGGQHLLDLSEGGGGANDYVAIQAATKFYLDGGGSTYIQESSDGVIDFYGDGVQLLTAKQNGTQSEVVVNEGSGDVDFRVESNNSTHAFFVDAAAAGKVGIGTAVPPFQKLTVTGVSAAVDGNAENGILALTTGTGVIADTRLLFGIVDDDYAWISAIDYGAAYRDIILAPADGNIGIGVTDPDARLEIKGAGTGSGLTFKTTDSSSNETFYIMDGGRVGVRYYPLVVGVASGATDPTTSGDRLFVSGTVGNVVIDDEGNLGVGASTPEKKLHVLTSTTDATPQMLIQNSSTGDASLTFNISGDSYTVGIDNSDADKFKISKGDLGTNDRFTMDENGAIEMGNNLTVGGSIDVNGNSNVIGDESTSSGTSVLTLSTYEPHLIFKKGRDASSGYDYFKIKCENPDMAVDFTTAYNGGGDGRTARITSNGRWVIGGHEEVNSSQLSVQGNFGIKQPDDSGFDGGLTIERSANTQKVHIGMDGGAVNFNSPDGLTYKFRNNGTEKASIDSSGNITAGGKFIAENVGSNFTHSSSWGTNLQLTNTNDDASPSVLTFLKDPASGYTTMADNDYIGFINFRADNSNNDIFSWVELSALALDVTDGDEDSAFRIGTWGGGTEYANTIIASSGKVGINTASPTARLHVNGTGATHGEYLRISNGTTQVYELQPSIYNVTNNGFGIYDVTDGAYRFVIDTDGSIGLGTSSPSLYYGHKLVVVAPDENGITIAGTGADQKQYLCFADGSSGDARYAGFISYDHNDNSMQLATNGGSAAITIDSSQNVTFSGHEHTIHIGAGGGVGTFVTSDDNDYPRITTPGASAQLGLFRSVSSAGGVYIGADSGGFDIRNDSFAVLFQVDMSGNVQLDGAIQADGASGSSFYAASFTRSGSGTDTTPDLWSDSNNFVLGYDSSNYGLAIRDEGVAINDTLVVQSGSPEVYFYTTGNHHNWMVAAQENVDTCLEFSVTGSTTTSLDYDASNYTRILTLYQNGNATLAGTFTASGDVVAYSDERLKTDIKTLDGSKVYEMRGVGFTKDDKKGSGVIAQELEKIAPELVNNESKYKSVAYGNLTGYLIEAIKDLKAEIEELKKCNKCNNCDCK